MKFLTHVFVALAVLSVLPAVSLSQVRKENHGKYGTWYFNSKNAKFKDDEEDSGVPVLEKPDHMPYTWRWNLGPVLSSVFVPAVKFNSYTSVQVNVDSQGHNKLGDAANEPSLAVDPTNRNHIVVGWREFDSVTSNFRQAGNAYSNDGGASWHNNQVFTPGTFRSDPVLDVDASGHFFYNSLQETFFTDVFGSTNGGSFWSFLGPATGGDKQWMVVDRSNSVGRGNMYEWWSTAGNNYGGRQFSRSTDNGKTWLDPIFVPSSPIWGVLDVAPNGNVYLAGLGDSSFVFCRSSNAKNRNQIPTFDMVVPINLGGGLIYGSNINPDGLMGQTWIAVDKSSGKTSGNIYVLGSVAVDNNNPADVNFIRSTDGGQTWSSPARLNDDPKNAGASHWFGTLSVAPNGRIDACWYDNRANPSINNSALFFTSSYDGGLTWHKNVQLGPYFNPNIGYPQQNKMGDYMGMVSDNDGADIAYASTYNNEEDIWFLRVPSLVSQVVSASAISTLEGTYVSGNVASVQVADGNNYDVASLLIKGLGYTASAQADFVLPVTSASNLTVHAKVATHALSSGQIYLYNWATSKYDYQLPFAISPTGFVEVTLPLPAQNLTNYIDSTGKVRVLLRALAAARRPGSGNYQLQIDLFELLFG